VIDRVDPPAQRVELLGAQAESDRSEVSDHDPDSRRERIVPKFGVLHDGANPLEPVRVAFGPNQAVHDQSVLLPHQPLVIG